jgi:hypothetical protein
VGDVDRSRDRPGAPSGRPAAGPTSCAPRPTPCRRATSWKRSP